MYCAWRFNRAHLGQHVQPESDVGEGAAKLQPLLCGWSIRSVTLGLKILTILYEVFSHTPEISNSIPDVTYLHYADVIIAEFACVVSHILILVLLPRPAVMQLYLGPQGGRSKQGQVLWGEGG